MEHYRLEEKIKEYMKYKLTNSDLKRLEMLSPLFWMLLKDIVHPKTRKLGE